jgi:Ca-activated chloride channel family protein
MSGTIRLRRAVQILRVVAIALLVMGMARPQTGRRQTRVSTEGVDIMLVLDTSGSMRALDFDADKPITARRNRFQVARDVVREFVKAREQDQLGLVLFGEEAFTQCPLTLDHGVLLTLLDRADIGAAGENRTAIGSALGAAVNRLKKSKAKSKVIVLLTDGRNNSGSLSPRKAAEVAQAFGIRIYTVGAGTHGKAPFLVDSFFGQQVTYQDEEIDDQALTELATIGGGRYFRATDVASLKDTYATIDRLEKTKIEINAYMEYDERFAWFVLPAFGLLLLEIGALGTRLRKIP